MVIVDSEGPHANKKGDEVTNLRTGRGGLYMYPSSSLRLCLMSDKAISYLPLLLGVTVYQCSTCTIDVCDACL